MIDSAGREPTVLVVGSIHHDRSLLVPRLPGPGETVISGRTLDGLGGKGANQAVAVARTGVHCDLLGVVGDDGSAVVVRRELLAHGVSVAQVGVVPGRQTGRATVVVEDAGENLIIVEPGPVDLIARNMIDANLCDRDTPPAVVVVQGEVPAPVICWTAESAKEAGSRFVLNLAPVLPVDLAALRQADPLVVNEHEATALLELLDGTPRTVDGLDDALGVARRLIGTGIRSLVITLGADGAVLADRHRVHHEAAFPATVVDTTGAGDCFTGTLAAGLACGYPLVEATRRGMAAASIAVGQTGAATAYPTRAQVDAVLHSGAVLR
ncbi:ribokinase [Micromonospora sp. NPDC048830]|uniref:ribokinase n=1 Tax=Micromonospora sp. NPDC048830 TaxID=3364257 RepID=UPI00371923FF